MILYCDTSALIKRYVKEDGTQEVNRLWDEASGIVTSVVAFAEGVAVFHRKTKDGILPHKECGRVLQKFKSDYDNFILMPINRHVNAIVEKVAGRHPLRGFDAIHLASALVFHQSGNEDLEFACFDQILNKAAGAEGLHTAIEV